LNAIVYPKTVYTANSSVETFSTILLNNISVLRLYTIAYMRPRYDRVIIWPLILNPMAW